LYKFSLNCYNEAMKNRLTEQILENYNCYKNDILGEIEEFSYRKKRYEVDFTISLFISSEKIDFDFIEESIRDTDKAIVLDHNFIAVIFDFATEETGLKATENLLALLEPRLFSDEIYISVVNSHDRIDDDEHVRKALDLLIDNINNGFKDIPKLPSC